MTPFDRVCRIAKANGWTLTFTNTTYTLSNATATHIFPCAGGLQLMLLWIFKQRIAAVRITLTTIIVQYHGGTTHTLQKAGPDAFAAFQAWLDDLLAPPHPPETRL
jgi:hypothetical protein